MTDRSWDLRGIAVRRDSDSGRRRAEGTGSGYLGSRLCEAETGGASIATHQLVTCAWPIRGARCGWKSLGSSLLQRCSNRREVIVQSSSLVGTDRHCKERRGWSVNRRLLFDGCVLNA